MSSLGSYAAYSHLFVMDTSIHDVSGATVYNGTVDSHVDIVSIGLHYRWDESAVETKMFVK